MPKTPRAPEEISIVKDHILGTALKIIVELGFQKLSMRKIAAQIGISPTTIYNYYNSKDELYFMIRIHGFELLHRSFEDARIADQAPLGRIKAMIERYLQFGMDYPDYYDVMFTNRIVPKYRECLGTRLEAVAARDRETALKSLSLVELALMDLHSSDPDYNKEDARYGAIRLWCDINGVITLKNSRLLHEVEEDVERLVRRLAEDIFARHRE